MNEALNQKILQTLLFILNTFQNKKFNFVIVGSTNLLIQDITIEAHDIDIVTTKKDAFKMCSLLKQYEIQEMSYSSTKEFRSWFGKLNVNGLVIEIMAELEFRDKNNNWIKSESLKNKQYIDYQGFKVPVKSLEGEKEFYQQINRDRDKEKIILIDEKLSSMKKPLKKQMNLLKIVLIRHGESEANRLGVYQGHTQSPLSENGKEQAIEVGKKLLTENHRFSRIYSSDLIRAAETTQIIAKILGIKEIIYSKKLRELKLGDFEGEPIKNLSPEDQKLLESFWDDHSKRIPNGETVNEMKVRIFEAFHEITEKEKNNAEVLIIGHGGTLFHILKSLLDIFPGTVEWFENGKITEITYDLESKKGKIIRYNDRYLI